MDLLPTVINRRFVQYVLTVFMRTAWLTISLICLSADICWRCWSSSWLSQPTRDECQEIYPPPCQCTRVCGSEVVPIRWLGISIVWWESGDMWTMWYYGEDQRIQHRDTGTVQIRREVNSLRPSGALFLVCKFASQSKRLQEKKKTKMKITQGISKRNWHFKRSLKDGGNKKRWIGSLFYVSGRMGVNVKRWIGKQTQYDTSRNLKSHYYWIHTNTYPPEIISPVKTATKSSNQHILFEDDRFYRLLIMSIATVEQQPRRVNVY